MVWPARFAILLLLVCAPAGAQELASRSPGADETPSPAASEPLKSALPDKPAPQGNFLTRPFYDKKVLLLAGINAGAAVWDDAASREVIERGGIERNPLMRPFVHNTGTIVAESAAEVWVMAFVADRMKRSSHPLLRKTWWLPQTLNFTAKFGGGIYNTVLLSR